MSESLITKKAIAAGLKELMKRKSFDKITISDITNECGLNRQTFYYHFQDKYELVNWIYYNEAISVIVSELDFNNWDKKVLELLTIMKNDAHFYQSALKSTGSVEFQNYLFCLSKEIFSDVIDKIAGSDEIDDFDKNFLAEFISHGTVGMISAWAEKGMKQSPEVIVSHLKKIVEGAKATIAERYLKEKIMPSKNPDGMKMLFENT